LREEALNQIDFKGSLINISFEAGMDFLHEIEVFHQPKICDLTKNKSDLTMK
jgi:hypothetical protein